MSSASAREEYQAAVAAYVAAGGEESVQRVITAIFGVTKRLDQWYDRQLADLAISHGDWAVLAHLAQRDGGPETPSRLADAAQVAPSSMTARLDRMCGRGLLERRPDQANRTRVLVTMTDAGWELFASAIRESRSAHPARGPAGDRDLGPRRALSRVGARLGRPRVAPVVVGRQGSLIDNR